MINDMTKKTIEEKKQIIECGLSDVSNRNNGKLLYDLLESAKDISIEYSLEVIDNCFAKGRKQRFIELVRPNMKRVEESEFIMGSEYDSDISYCGEYPEHKVTIKEHLVSKIPVIEELYVLYNPMYKKLGNGGFPVTNVSWYDAYMFSIWMDARLLTEAEWEHDCTYKKHWCTEESNLVEYAWYSENSNGVIHRVAQKRPNQLGIYDMHGNTWEWCQDSYDENFYLYSPSFNPCNREKSNVKVCRGGSIHAFSEMCRKEFRSYEQASFKAYDLSFRLAKSV